MFKKIAVIFLAVVMCLCFAACGGSADGQNGDNEGVVADQNVGEMAFATPEGFTADGENSNDTCKVYLNEDGTVQFMVSTMDKDTLFSTGFDTSDIWLEKISADAKSCDKVKIDGNDAVLVSNENYDGEIFEYAVAMSYGESAYVIAFDGVDLAAIDSSYLDTLHDLIGSVLM